MPAIVLARSTIGFYPHLIFAPSICMSRATKLSTTSPLIFPQLEPYSYHIKLS
jgi:hypothetical protein